MPAQRGTEEVVMSHRVMARGALVFWAAALCLAAPPARAQEADAQTLPELSVAIVCAEPVASARETADQRIVDAAFAALGRGGYAGLNPHIDALTRVMEEAPACYPRFERRGTSVIMRTNDPGEMDSSATLGVLLIAAAEGRQTEIVGGTNIYPGASLLLAAHANEFRRYEEAVAWLDRGLALQPQHQYLISEKAVALNALGRHAEAAALYQDALDHPEFGANQDRARLLRGLGVTLIDLDRLDDAEAALNQSLELQPGNALARNELAYIAELRAGGARRAFELSSPAPTGAEQPAAK
jgi:tetratricopeptide (TPR) repeat protein